MARAGACVRHCPARGHTVARALRLHQSGEALGGWSIDQVWLDHSSLPVVRLLGFPFVVTDGMHAKPAEDLEGLGKLLERLLQATTTPQSAPAQIQRLIQELMAAGTTSKLPTITAVADALEALLAEKEPDVDMPVVNVANEATSNGLARLKLQRQMQRSRQTIVLVGLAVLACIGLMGGGYWWLTLPPAQSVDTVATAASPQSSVEQVALVDPTPTPIEVDDPTALWQSPTAGTPIALRYLPLGSPCYIVWRASDFLRHSEGEKLLDTLGPIGQPLRDEVVELLGVPLDEVDRLTLGLYDAGPAAWQASLVVELGTPPALDELLDLLGQPQPEDVSAGLAYRSATHTYYFPHSQTDLFAVVPHDRLDEVVASGEAAPLLRREFEQLLSSTDADRQFTMLFAPTFFWHGGGQPLLAGLLQPLKEWFTQLIGDQTRAVAAAIHLDENFFLEVRVVGPTDERPAQGAERLEAEVVRLPDDIERRLQAETISPYSRPVLERYPLMVRLWSEHTRVAIDGRDVVLRSYLPAVAAHNLALGLQLSLFVGQEFLAEPESMTTPPEGAGGGLTQIVSLSFPRNTLERALEMLSEEIGVPIEILGNDLQLEGITKNQSFGLDLRERPAVEILRAILLRASPDGKLVYIPREADGEQPMSIVVSTRAAATKRGDPLPPEFIE